MHALKVGVKTYTVVKPCSVSSQKHDGSRLSDIVGEASKHMNLEALVKALLSTSLCTSFKQFDLNACSLQSSPYGFKLRRYRAHTNCFITLPTGQSKIVEMLEFDPNTILFK